jgi:hypothetical protein
MFLSGNLPVLRGGVETDMSQMLLQQSQPIAGIIHLHSVNAEGVSQAVRANASGSPGLRINQCWQAEPSSTVPDDLPSPVPVDIKEVGLVINRAQGIDIAFGHSQGVFVNGKYPYSPSLHLTSQLLIDLAPASRAEAVSVP